MAHEHSSELHDSVDTCPIALLILPEPERPGLGQYALGQNPYLL